jgi:hypothetical protein
MTKLPTVTLTLEVERAGKVELFDTASATMLIGSGSHCDVRLLPEEAQVEQLLLESRGDRVFVRSLTHDGSLRLGRAVFEEGDLAPGTQLALGDLSLRIGLRTREERGAAGGDSAASTLVTRAVLILAIAVGLYKVAFPAYEHDVLGQLVSAPLLFEEAANRDCKVADERDAAYQAQRWLVEASLKQERAPFYPKDGVASVQLYEAAEACLLKAGRAAQAEAVHELQTQLRAALQDEFQVRQVRLERFLQGKKHSHAQQEVQVLLAFTSHRDGPYVQWLGAVQRQLTARFASTVRSR